MLRLVTTVLPACAVLWLSAVDAVAQQPGQPGQQSRNTTGQTGNSSVGQTGQTGNAAGGRPQFNLGFTPQAGGANFGSGFVGGSQNQGRVVGNQFAGQQSLSGGGRGNNTFGRGGRGGRGGGRFNMPQQGRNSRTARVRPRLRVAFSLQPRTMAAVQMSLDSRFLQVVKLRKSLKAVTISVGEKGELTLKGEVPDVAARRLAANLVRMEPGVRKLINELSVTAAEASGESGGS